MEVNSVSDTQRAFYRLEWAQYPGGCLSLGALSPSQRWLEPDFCPASTLGPVPVPRREK